MAIRQVDKHQNRNAAPKPNKKMILELTALRRHQDNLIGAAICLTGHARNKYHIYTYIVTGMEARITGAAAGA